MVDILSMDRNQILCLEPRDVLRALLTDDVVHIAKTLGAFWQYDYEAAKAGRVGLHAELKSGLHSDGFFVSKILLAPENVRSIMSMQIARCIVKKLGKNRPDYISGIPDEATSLGIDVAKNLDVKVAEMRKIDGRIFLTMDLCGGDILLVEDFFTRGTGFTEVVTQIRDSQPDTKVWPYNVVILNRGETKKINVPKVGSFQVLSVVEKRIEDWDPKKKCPLCEIGSKPIKPKASDENWSLLNLSQL